MNRESIYQKVTQDIMKLLERGEVVWHKTWIDGLQTNLFRKKPYNGINQFALTAGMLWNKYEHPYWVTFKQAMDLGGHVKEGEHSLNSVVKWLFYDEKDENGKKVPGGDHWATAKYSNVFNVAQCEGLEIPTHEVSEIPPMEQCEEIIRNMVDRPVMTEEPGRAYYSPSEDRVNVPCRNQFDKSGSYYNVLFHEYGHATGHDKRLGRSGVMDVHRYGDHAYSQEELCAESCASFLGGLTGLDMTLENSAAYIQGWLKKLKKDPACLVHGMQQGQAAADYILGVEKENDHD